MELYNRIKMRREELGLSQVELAKKLGYKSRSSINKIESGENDIPQSKIAAFAKALETTPAYLMGIKTELDFQELELFEEILAFSGWSYESMSDCEGLEANRYLPDNEKQMCQGSMSPEQCKGCKHGEPYYYLHKGNSYYKLSKEEFDSLSSCVIPYLQFRINEIIQKKTPLTEQEFRNAECMWDDDEMEAIAAHERTDIEVTEEMRELDNEYMDGLDK